MQSLGQGISTFDLSLNQPASSLPTLLSFDGELGNTSHFNPAHVSFWFDWTDADGTPHTGACQFFITQVPYPSLDPPSGNYTIFGQVVEGQEVVPKISHVIRDDNDRPRIPSKLINVTFMRIVAPAPAVP